MRDERLQKKEARCASLTELVELHLLLSERPLRASEPRKLILAMRETGFADISQGASERSRKKRGEGREACTCALIPLSCRRKAVTRSWLALYSARRAWSPHTRSLTAREAVEEKRGG